MTARRHCTWHPRRGFTLMEALASIVILSIIGTIASNIIIVSADGYFMASTRAELHAQASVALDRIVRELRSIPNDSAETDGGPDIANTTAVSIQWNTTDGEVSQFLLADGNLMFAESGGIAAVLQSDVSQFQLRLFDESNSAIGPVLTGPACDQIRRIEITLTLSRAGISETLRTRVFARAAMAGVQAP